jgi:HAD superfamily hydrolase (TIGR01509 family)
MLKAVIFDMDGVIVDSEPLHHKAYQKMFLDFDLNISDKLYESFTGQATLAICQRLCDEFSLKLEADVLINSKRQHFDILFEEAQDFELISGVLDLIEDYYKAGLTLILGSSASMQNINRIFKRFDLDKYFKTKFSGADLKESKPHPEIFIKAAAATGYFKENCFVIEDSTNGILAAKAAGLFCVGFDSPHSKNQDYSKADLTITSFKEIHYSKIKTYF